MVLWKSVQKIGGDIQKSPEPINFEIVNQNDNEITFISPNKKGAYRIFAFVKNEKGQSSVANIPFLVEQLFFKGFNQYFIARSKK